MPHHSSFRQDSPFRMHPGSAEPRLYRLARFLKAERAERERESGKIDEAIDKENLTPTTIEPTGLDFQETTEPGSKVATTCGIIDGRDLVKFKKSNKLEVTAPGKDFQVSPRTAMFKAQSKKEANKAMRLEKIKAMQFTPPRSRTAQLTRPLQPKPDYDPWEKQKYTRPANVPRIVVSNNRVTALRVRDNMTAATGSPAPRQNSNGQPIGINGQPVKCERVEESPVKVTTNRASAADKEAFKTLVSPASSDQSSVKDTDMVSFKSSIVASGVPLGDIQKNAPGLVSAFIESARLKAPVGPASASSAHNNSSSTGSAETDISAQLKLKFEAYRIADDAPPSPPFCPPPRSRGNNSSRPTTANTSDGSWPSFPPQHSGSGAAYPHHNPHPHAGSSNWAHGYVPTAGNVYGSESTGINVYRAATSDNVPRGPSFMQGGVRSNKGMLSYAQDGPTVGRSGYNASYISNPYGPIGTRLSPTAAEFSAPTAPQPWNPSHLGKHVFLHPYQQVNWRHLLEPGVTADWDLIVDKIISNNDQQASIFLQQKIKNSDNSIKDDIIKSIINRGLELMGNRFGNFLIQRVFECANPTQIMGLADHIRGHTVRLSTDAFGCHVVQKAFDCVPESFKFEMVAELLTRISETVVHRYACHVWQKLFELRWQGPPPMIMGTVNKALRGNWTTVALGETGSLVVQNIFENCGEEDKRPCVDEVIANLHIIARGQFGNWCIQHICEHGSPTDRNDAICKILAHAAEYSMDQYASKVIEKCLKVCGTEFLEDYLTSVLTRHPGDNFSPLVQIARDQYGNFLIQWILNNATPHLRDVVQAEIRKHLVSLRGNKYGSKVALSCGYGPQGVRPGVPFAPANHRQHFPGPPRSLPPPPPQMAAYPSYYAPAYSQLDGAGSSYYPPTPRQSYGYYPSYN